MSGAATSPALVLASTSPRRRELLARIGLKPARRIPLCNGALECRLYVFELIAGSLRRSKTGERQEARGERHEPR